MDYLPCAVEPFTPDQNNAIVMPQECQKFDIVIFRVETRKIDAIGGRDLPETGSFHTSVKRLETVLERLNDSYSAAAVPAGKFNEGDILPQDYAS